MDWQSHLLALASVTLTEANEGNIKGKYEEDKESKRIQVLHLSERLSVDRWDKAWMAPPLSPVDFFLSSSSPWITLENAPLCHTHLDDGLKKTAIKKKSNQIKVTIAALMMTVCDNNVSEDLDHYLHPSKMQLRGCSTRWLPFSILGQNITQSCCLPCRQKKQNSKGNTEKKAFYIPIFYLFMVLFLSCF